MATSGLSWFETAQERLLTMRDYTPAFSAMNARQPPNAEMSRAPLIPAGSTTNPFTPLPSASRIVPIPSGGGIAATNLPNAAAAAMRGHIMLVCEQYEAYAESV